MTYESSMPDKYADIDHPIVSNIELEWIWKTFNY